MNREEKVPMPKHQAKGPYEAFFKRLIDVICSVLFVLLFFWLYLILALIVRINLGAPVIFTQERPGRNGKIFKLYKFRSMSDKRDENGELLPDQLRLNKFGRILRSTSLDELPELFNIIKGDMSFVGPRPLLVKYLDHYNAHDMRRHEVRPGLTGLAQVSGRNAMSWKEKFQKDVEYVDHVTFLMDVKVILLTIRNVLRREGIEFTKGHQTIMEYFEQDGRRSE
uniref:UDP-phosphate galactose phosphotransferase n=1 Tax=uncultured bacterium Contig248 TaxID=1393544 RepID=W0FM56_9BACT|nr:UDP-phosphate galactose phosphotransferase [uncultured bacterium Contig248]